ncbi:AsnC family transcriptional regulator [Kitasatospora terrestris]|uniref:Lrp/AsnC family transcriptional regulator n=1 Tax=Kitasatospora terrestris TaxID=258051 RepID=A0ABP9DEL6_9ACTN
MESDSYDLLDRQLAHALQLNGRAPFSRIARALGVSDQTVARRYARLVGTGALRVLGLSAPHALGEERWLLRVQCTPDAAGALAEALARREDTTWVGLSAGGTEINCGTRFHPDQQDGTLLLQRLPRTPSVVGVTAQCVIHTFFGGAQGLAIKSGALTAEQVALLLDEAPAPTGPPPVLERTDRRLLDALAVDGRANLTDLAAATGWSAATVRRRMDELERHGALYYDLDLDWRVFGLRTTALLWLSVPPSRLAATGEALAAHPELAFVCATTGPTNLHAVLLCPDVRSVYTYLTTRIAALDAVDRVESAPVLRTVKGPGPFRRPPTRAARPATAPAPG